MPRNIQRSLEVEISGSAAMAMLIMQSLRVLAQRLNR